MRFMVLAILVGLLAWCGWWWIAAGAQRSAWETVLETDPQAALRASADDVTVRGFPSRVDTTLTNPQIFDAQTGWGWKGPIFQVLMLSYKPNHFIAAWPDEQQILTPTGVMAVTSDRMQASLVVEPNTDLSLDRFRFEAMDVALKGQIGATLEQINLAISQWPDAPSSPVYEIGFLATDLRISGPQIKPLEFSTAKGTGLATFKVPIDRHVLDSGMPDPVSLSINSLTFELPKGKLEMSGKITVDNNGLLSGKINIQPSNSGVLGTAIEFLGDDPGLVVAAGLLGLGRAPLTISIRAGQMRLEPMGIPLGMAPRF